MSARSAEVRDHLEAALAHLNIDDEIERLVNPRHTDHDRHSYLPRKAVSAVASAREEISAALNDSGALPDPKIAVGLEAAVDSLVQIETMLDRMIERESPDEPPARLPATAREALGEVRLVVESAMQAL